MAVLSVSEIKRGTRQSKRQKTPRAGTKPHKVYMDLIRYGRVLYRHHHGTTLSNQIRYLSDFYGVDTKPLNDGEDRGYALVGIWDGPYFVTADRLLEL